MASNTSVEATASDENQHIAPDASSPVVSVDSSINKTSKVSSEDEPRTTCTPEIREPSEKSTPVSPMDNSFFPGPDKWWYQKEWEQRSSKRGFFLDLEPENWWGCRRHSETDIIGLPPSVERRHSLTPELSCSKPVAIKEEKEEQEQTSPDFEQSNDDSKNVKSEDRPDNLETETQSAEMEIKDSPESTDVFDSNEPNDLPSMKEETIEQSKDESPDSINSGNVKEVTGTNDGQIVATDSKPPLEMKEEQCVSSEEQKEAQYCSACDHSEVADDDEVQDGLPQSETGQMPRETPESSSRQEDNLGDKVNDVNSSQESTENTRASSSLQTPTLISEEELVKGTGVLQQQTPPETPPPSIVIHPEEAVLKDNLAKPEGEEKPKETETETQSDSSEISHVSPDTKYPTDDNESALPSTTKETIEQTKDDMKTSLDSEKSLNESTKNIGQSVVTDSKSNSGVTEEQLVLSDKNETIEKSKDQSKDSMESGNSLDDDTSNIDLPKVKVMEEQSVSSKKEKVPDSSAGDQCPIAPDVQDSQPLSEAGQSSDESTVPVPMEEFDSRQEENLDKVTDVANGSQDQRSHSQISSSEIPSEDKCQSKSTDELQEETPSHTPPPSIVIHSGEEDVKQSFAKSDRISSDTSPSAPTDLPEGQEPLLHDSIAPSDDLTEADCPNPSDQMDLNFEKPKEIQMVDDQNIKGDEVNISEHLPDNLPKDHQNLPESDVQNTPEDRSDVQSANEVKQLSESVPNEHDSKCSRKVETEDLSSANNEQAMKFEEEQEKIEPIESLPEESTVLTKSSLESVIHRRGKSQLEKVPESDRKISVEPIQGEREPDSDRWNSFKIFIVISVVLLLVGYLALSNLVTLTISVLNQPSDGTVTVSKPSSKPSREAIFHQHLRRLEEAFPSQSPVLWNVVGGAAFSHIQDPPMLERPVVLLLAALPGSESTTHCLATQLGTMFYDIFQSTKEPVLVYGKEHKDASADEAKTKIDISLKTGLQTGSNCGIIHNLDDIPPCAIILFHSYCENDNAPFKDAAIVHTVMLNQVADVLGELKRPKDYERVVSKYLRGVWEPCPDLTEDKQSAMLSRVANNVAVVKAESQSQLRKVCS